MQQCRHALAVGVVLCFDRLVLAFPITGYVSSLLHSQQLGKAAKRQPGTVYVPSTFVVLCFCCVLFPQVTARLRELHSTIEAGERHRNAVLQTISFNLEEWTTKVGASLHYMLHVLLWKEVQSVLQFHCCAAAGYSLGVLLLGQLASRRREA
jgi:hypothetical protein